MKSKLGQLPFGKHQGALIASIAAKNLKYLHWLLEQEWLQKYLRILVSGALDIDATILTPSPPSLSTPRFGYRIERPERILE